MIGLVSVMLSDSETQVSLDIIGVCVLLKCLQQRHQAH